MGLPGMGSVPAQADAYLARGQAVYGALDQASQGELGPMLGLAGGLARGIDPSSPAGAAIVGALQGATTGAAVGSVIPGIGTVVGALVGAVFGLITGLLGMAPTDDRPPYVQKAEAVPTPGSTSNPFNCDAKLSCPPVTGDQLFGFDLAFWWRAHLHGERFAYGNLGNMVALGVASALLSADGAHGTMLVDAGGAKELKNAWARWNRWVTGPSPDPSLSRIPDHPVNLSGASPLYFPADTDSYGWFLNGCLWLMAAQGRSDVEVLQWAVMQQWVLKTMGGPVQESHLMWLVGRLHELVSPGAQAFLPPRSSLVVASGKLSLVRTPPAPSSGSSGGAAVAAGAALALLFFL